MNVFLLLLSLSWMTSTLSQQEDEDYDDYDEQDDSYNTTGLGEVLGGPCIERCNPRLLHAFCHEITHTCECQKKFPVRLGKYGCAKPVLLGDPCFYDEACNYTDQHAWCKQIEHKAICHCKSGYHTVSLQRHPKKIFCAEDLVLLTTDIPTLLGVLGGIGVFSGLICFVLKLFSRDRFARTRHYANANLAPPILFSSETGIPLAIQRPSSRTSSQRSTPISRRPSGTMLVPHSRAGAARAAAILLISCHIEPSTSHRDDMSRGSRRASISSIHSNGSARSYSLRRFEKEREQKTLRQSMKAAANSLPVDRGPSPSPSPRTPVSTDELLPVLNEVKEDVHPLVQPTASTSCDGHYQNEMGPGTSSSVSR